MSQMIKKWLPVFLKNRKLWMNKYLIAGICFLVWVFIFDKYNFQTQRNLSLTMEKLEAEKIRYEEQIKETRERLIDIDINKERYARERYYMHKPNEEILVINQE